MDDQQERLLRELRDKVMELENANRTLTNRLREVETELGKIKLDYKAVHTDLYLGALAEGGMKYIKGKVMGWVLPTK